MAADNIKKNLKAKLQAVVCSNVLNHCRCLWLFFFSCKEWLRLVGTAAVLYLEKQTPKKLLLTCMH